VHATGLKVSANKKRGAVVSGTPAGWLHQGAQTRSISEKKTVYKLRRKLSKSCWEALFRLLKFAMTLLASEGGASTD